MPHRKNREGGELTSASYASFAVAPDGTLCSFRADGFPEWLAKGAAALDRKLWAGDRYLVYSDPGTGRRLDASLLNQLVGDWCTRQLGLESVFPPDRVARTIESVIRRNVALAAAVPIDTVDREGRPVDLPEMGSDPAAHQASACMVSEAVCLAMTLLWNARPAEGLAILESIWKAHAIDHRTPFEQYYLLRPEDGKPIWGNDYYPNPLGSSFQTWKGPDGERRTHTRIRATPRRARPWGREVALYGRDSHGDHQLGRGQPL